MFFPNRSTTFVSYNTHCFRFLQQEERAKEDILIGSTPKKGSTPETNH